MVKIILGVLSLLVMLSCSTAVKENTTQPDIMETNKKNLGNLLALYPKPMTVVGAEVEGKVNWLVVGHTGVIGHDRILVSMSKSHYTNQGIKKSKRLSVNLVSREMLPKADYVGSVSGALSDPHAFRRLLRSMAGYGKTLCERTCAGYRGMQFRAGQIAGFMP